MNGLTPTTGKYLADTSVLVKLLRGDETVKRRLLGLESIYICIHILGELYVGAHKSKQATKNLVEIDDLSSTFVFISGDLETARAYGILKRDLQVKGRMIPENDLWIAATALRHELTLITFDAHFDLIDHLTKERW